MEETQRELLPNVDRYIPIENNCFYSFLIHVDFIEGMKHL